MCVELETAGRAVTFVVDVAHCTLFALYKNYNFPGRWETGHRALSWIFRETLANLSVDKRKCLSCKA